MNISKRTASLMVVSYWSSLTSRAAVPIPPSRPKPVERVVKGNCCREPTVENDRNRFPEDLDESNTSEVPLPFWNKDDCLPRAFLGQSPIKELCLHNGDHL